MVRATYTVDEGTHTLVVVGHANYAEYGKDIVCAGVSAIVQSLIGWCEENYETVNCMSIDTKEGEVVISCDGGIDVSSVFYMAFVGLEQLANSYPDHVQINSLGIAD